MNDEPTTRFGKYELLERIGTGGMAEIYRARITGAHGFEKIVVVKKILPAYASNPAFVKMLVAEAKISSMLHHPNIVQTHELGEVDGQYYIAMEHVAGVDWLEVLSRCAERGDRPPTEVVVFVMSEVLKGLHHAHEATDVTGRALNLVHRDVSPSNIFVSYEGEVKLMDFGVARTDLDESAPERRRARERSQQATLVKGKLAYQSPELVARQGLDHRSDLFALGVVLFESLTLKRLFTGDSELELLSKIRDADIEAHLSEHPYLPESIVSILRRALARHPHDRFESAEVFQEALLDYLFEMRVRISGSNLAQALGGILEIEPVQAAAAGPIGDAPNTRPTRRASAAAPPVSNTRPMRSNPDDSSPFEGPSLDVTPVLGISPAVPAQPPKPSVHATVPTSPIYEGTLDALAIPHFLYRLAIHQSTGRLVLDSGSVNKEVWFRGGVPIQVKSSAIDELFGEMLVADSLVERSVLDGAIEECQRDGRPLGEVLVNAGALPPHRLLRLLEEQFRMRYLELFAWEAGTYAFFAGEPEPSDTTWMGTDPFELIAEGVRSHVGEDRLAAVYAPMMETPFVHRDNPHITHNNLRLSSRELRCYGYLADVSCLSAALEVCQDDERVSMFQVVFVLEQTCLLGFESTEP